MPVKHIDIAAALFVLTALCAQSVRADPLHFSAKDGLTINEFFQDGPIASHTVLRSGSAPRILVAFPAGNSGVALWFDRTSAPVEWIVTSAPAPVQRVDSRARKLYGTRVDVQTGAASLQIRQALLSSVRVLRDFESGSAPPRELLVDARTEGSALTWARDRLDGAAGYFLELHVTEGTLQGQRILADRNGHIGLRITAASGEPPLQPFIEKQILTVKAQPDIDARRSLQFLAYREKLLAGSWRFNTYFGRDTLISARLLMPVLTREAMEAGLGSVLTRLSGTGEVAHEEDIGEFAILDHQKSGEGLSDAPVFDYRMIDGDYLLAPVLASWLLDDPRGRARAAQFLGSQDGRAGATRTRGEIVMRNLRLVLHSAQAFADKPVFKNLVSLKAGMDAGNWRDSQDGLGGGRYPYDVNSVLVPAALRAADRLFRHHLLDPYLAPGDVEALERAASMARVWQAQAPDLFKVSIPQARARRLAAGYLETLDLPARLVSKGFDVSDIEFHALSLESNGTAIPVQHSDEGFSLLFGEPSLQDLRGVIDLLRPFPAGLLTPVGMLVANPAFASRALQAKFGRNAYHGTVIWSWQQALMLAGLDRQIRRSDLPAALRDRLERCRRQLWSTSMSQAKMRNFELWSWTWANGRFEPAAFGAANADADESNAAQLWSTVYLALSANTH